MILQVANNRSKLAAKAELQWMLRQSMTPRLRTVREFAEQELLIPSGRYKGQRFSVDRQPFTRLYLDEIGCPQQGKDNKYQIILLTGPSQSGKTTIGSVLPVLYHLFEAQETVIFGLPSMDMADNKWRTSILPAIEATRFRKYLPTTGSGSKDGRVKDMVSFGNGAHLKFMTAGGGDKSRAGFTARVLVITETDDFGTSSETSDEASKLDQLIARTNSFGDQALIYLECTVSTPQAPTWTRYNAGTATKILNPCPHCRALVSIERDDLQGWKESAGVIEAGEDASFFCPSCGQAFSDEQRRWSNANSKILHRGQSVEIDPDTGEQRIVGEAVKTDTFGFRWSGFHNMLWKTSDFGSSEWKASRSADEENAEKAQKQFVWCIPYESPAIAMANIDANVLTNRLGKWARGHVPEDCRQLVMTVDVQMYSLFWLLTAWRPNFAGHIVDYGVEATLSDQMSTEKGIYFGLNNLKEVWRAGFPVEGSGVMRQPDLVGIDLGYQRPTIVQFIHSTLKDSTTTGRFIGVQGFGAGQLSGQHYTGPKTTGATVHTIGEEYHLANVKSDGIYALETNADHWKGFFHQRISEELEPAGDRPSSALTLYNTIPREHTQIAKHFTAEKQVLEFIPGRGEVLKWQKKRKDNHWFDCGYMACVLGHFKGVRLPIQARTESKPSNDQEQASPRIVTPRGEAFCIMDRR